MVLGLLMITAIPTVTGVAQGVSQQRSQEEDKKRVAKFYLDVYCDAKSSKTKDLHGRRIVLRDEKVFIDEPVVALRAKPAYTLKAFYIQYPDDEREPTMGLVSQVADDPPMLNWIYVDKNTLELKYGNRSQSREHYVGPWDWTEDEKGLTIDGWEGLVAVQEDDGEWAVYYDRNDDRLKGKIGKKRVLQISLERTMAEDDT